MRHSSPPPLNACRVFEAAARLGSFVRAGDELHVSSTAVSHQIKLLEAWLGRRLFQRHPSGVSLTDAGLALLPVLGEALERLTQGVEAVAGRAPSRLVRISAQPNFALKWLVPRLKRFMDLYPAVEVHLITDKRSLDLASENIDIAVRYFDALPVGLQEISAKAAAELAIDELLRAELTPVASPLLLPPGAACSAKRLRDFTLLHMLSSPGDWQQWLEAAGVNDVDSKRGPKFDSYALTIEAAVHGIGIAIGRSAFLADDLASGRLVAPFPLRLASQSAWFLLTSRRTSPHAALFRKWILAEARTPAAVP